MFQCQVAWKKPMTSPDEEKLPAKSLTEHGQRTRGIAERIAARIDFCFSPAAPPKVSFFTRPRLLLRAPWRLLNGLSLSFLKATSRNGR
jgi:hypothetical protein